MAEAHSRSLWRLRSAHAVAAFAILGLKPVLAQTLTPQPPAISIQQLPGLNVAQQGMATSIGAVCPTLVVGAAQGLISGDTLDLRQVCTRMVQNANQVRGVGDTTNSYGLGAGQLASALQQINGDELLAPREQLAQTQGAQTGAVSGRLAALRLGVGGASPRLASRSVGPARTRYAMAGESTPGASAGQSSQPLAPPWSAFVTGNGSWGDQDSTPNSEGFEFSSGAMTAGADYRWNENLVIGAAAGFSRFNADFDVTGNSASGQSLESDNGTVSLYGTYYRGERFYFDGIASATFGSYDSERRVVIVSQTAQPSENRSANGGFDAVQYGLSLGGGYQWPIGAATLTPYARAAYQRTEVDGFTESGAAGLNLAYDSYNITSLTSTFGAQASYAISTEFGVLLPYLFAEWTHEFKNDQDGIGVKYAADPTELSRFTARFDSPDRNYFTAGLGVAVTLPAGWSAFASYDALLGMEDVRSNVFTVGARLEF